MPGVTAQSPHGQAPTGLRHASPSLLARNSPRQPPLSTAREGSGSFVYRPSARNQSPIVRQASPVLRQPTEESDPQKPHTVRRSASSGLVEPHRIRRIGDQSFGSSASILASSTSEASTAPPYRACRKQSTGQSEAQLSRPEGLERARVLPVQEIKRAFTPTNSETLAQRQRADSDVSAVSSIQSSAPQMARVLRTYRASEYREEAPSFGVPAPVRIHKAAKVLAPANADALSRTCPLDSSILEDSMLSDPCQFITPTVLRPSLSVSPSQKQLEICAHQQESSLQENQEPQSTLIVQKVQSRAGSFVPAARSRTGSFDAPTAPAKVLTEKQVNTSLGITWTVRGQPAQQAQVASETIAKVLTPVRRVAKVLTESSLQNAKQDIKDSLLHVMTQQQAMNRTPRFNLKLAIFDFDRTLAAIHVYAAIAGTMSSPVHVPPPFARSERGQLARLAELESDAAYGPDGFIFAAFGGGARVERIRKMLADLHAANTECIVCSRGMQAVVRGCLDRVNLRHSFTEIFGNTGSVFGTTEYDLSLPPMDSNPKGADAFSVSQSAGLPKDQAIKYAIMQRGLVPQQVVLIDDDMDEITKVRDFCGAIHVNHDQGVGDREHRMLKTILGGREVSFGSAL